MKIYEIKNNHNDFSHFYPLPEYFTDHTYWWDDSLVDGDYSYEMYKSEKGLKNFKLNISSQINHLLLNEDLKHFFEGYGDFFKVKTKSKNKKFVGFFPNKSILDNSVVDMELSEYDLLENGSYSLGKVFFNKNVENILTGLFVVKGKAGSVYVTDSLKHVLEANSALGISFTLTYDSENVMSDNWKFNLIKENLDNPQYGNVIRDAYNYYGGKNDFDAVVKKKKIAEEQPYLLLFDKYKDELYVNSDEFPQISKYELNCIKNKELRSLSQNLRVFAHFLSDLNVFLKSKYLVLCPHIKVFDDGVMINGRFVRNIL